MIMKRAAWSAVVLLGSSAAHAVTLADTQQRHIVDNVLSYVHSVTETSSPFAQWVHDSALFYAAACLRDEDKPLTQKLAQLGFNNNQQQRLMSAPLGTGTFSLDNDVQQKKACHLLAEQGVMPVCTEAAVISSARTPQTTLPANYAVVLSGAPVTLSITLNCSISHKTTASSNGVTSVDAVYSQHFTLTKEHSTKIEGQGVSSGEWVDRFSFRLIPSLPAGSQGNLIIHTDIRKEPFVWTLAAQ